MVPERWRPFVQLVLARMREFYREPVALFWVYGFPLLLVLVLGIAFSGREPPPPEVDVQEGPEAPPVLAVLKAEKFKVEIRPAAECQARLIQGKTDLYLVPGSDGVEYVYDRKRADSLLARYWVEATLLRATAGTSVRSTDRTIEEPGSRYIDFLLPGLVGTNLMGGGLFGIGFILVEMRTRKLFKRLMATPMRRSDFLLAVLASRLLFLVPEMFVLLVIGRSLFGVPIYGSVVTLGVVVVVGAAAFAGLGLLLASRTEKTETISGLVNLFMLPQYLLSGVFFPSSKFPDVMQPFIQALPLTQLNEALRAVMLEGAGFAEISWRLAILAAWAVVCFVLALRWFRWR
jgi:ABC transporter DrrB family efflux protein